MWRMSTLDCMRSTIMNTETKTHYRKVFKSDHLGVADLEDLIENGKELIFTIEQVQQEYGVKIAGKKVDKNIVYFKEDIKPWALNATNCGILKDLSGSVLIENWAGMTIRLFINPDVRFMGYEGGIRIHPKAVNPAKPTITKETVKMWENAKSAFLRDKNFDKVLERANISKENQNLMIAEIEDA